MKMWAIPLAVCLSLLINGLVRATAPELVFDDFQLAGVHLGHSQEQVKEVLGEPTEKSFDDMGNWVWTYDDKGLAITFGVVQHNPGAAIIIDANDRFKGKTRRNIGIGSTIAEAQQAYGDVPATSDYGSVGFVTDNPWGPGKVKRIVIRFHPKWVDWPKT